jgi:DNA polymerase III delta subunit
VKKEESKKIFVILGDKEFQKEKINFIVSSITGKHDFKEIVEFIPAGKHDWRKIFEQIKTYSLFGTPRFLVVEETDIFSTEKSTKDILENALECYSSGDFEKAFHLLLTALQSIDISENDYNNLKLNFLLVKKFFESFIDSTDFCVELLKKFELPERLPEKTLHLDFNDLINQIPEGNYLLITASSYDKRKKVFKELFKISKTFEQPQVKKDSLEFKKIIDSTINEMLKTHKKNISPDDLLLLQELAYETQSYKKHLEKLFLLVYDEDTIKEEHIRIAFEDVVLADSKLLSQYIKEKNIEKIISIVINPIQTKQDFIKLAGYLRNMIKNGIILNEFFENRNIKDYAMFQVLINEQKERVLYSGSSFFNQHPYYLFQCYQTVKNYDTLFLKSLYLKLFEIDKDLKSTQKKPVDLFVDFFNYMFNPRI